VALYGAACGNHPPCARQPNPQHRTNAIPTQRIRLYDPFAKPAHRQELETPLREFKHLVPKWSPVPFLNHDHRQINLCPQGETSTMWWHFSVSTMC